MTPSALHHTFVIERTYAAPPARVDEMLDKKAT
jgi:uncharacterized protein YndB with AHSA1/START domain